MRIGTFILTLAGLCAMLSPCMAQQTDLASLDTDSNGKVSVAEFKTYAESRLPDFEHLDKFVKQVDADENGEISADEFKGRMEKLAALQNMQESDEATDSDESTQDDDADNSKNIEEAQEAYNEMQESIEDLDFKTASERMTSKAKDGLCVQMVIMGLGLANADLPMQIPGLSDTQDELQEVMEVYGLDKLDIDTDSMFRMSFGDDDSDDEDLKEKAADAKDQSKTILEALDKDGKRWEIIKAIWRVQSDSPFAHSPLNGKIDESAADGDAVLLTVSAKPNNGGGGGVQIQIVAPPTIVRMEKDNGNWMYAGVDEERTRKAMEEFMENMPMGGGAGGNRTDF